MSRKSRKLHTFDVRVLAHWQSADSQTATHVPREVAELLVHRLVCQQISQRVIRMFSPEAVFAVVKYNPEIQRYIPENLPPAEVEGVFFQDPTADQVSSSIPRMHNLPRYREVWGDEQLLVSQGSARFWPEGMDPTL